MFRTILFLFLTAIQINCLEIRLVDLGENGFNIRIDESMKTVFVENHRNDVSVRLRPIAKTREIYLEKDQKYQQMIGIYFGQDFGFEPVPELEINHLAISKSYSIVMILPIKAEPIKLKKFLKRTRFPGWNTLVSSWGKSRKGKDDDYGMVMVEVLYQDHWKSSSSANSQ